MARKRKGGAAGRRHEGEEWGQYMMMLFPEAHPVELVCWICDARLGGSRDLAAHVIGCHSGYCSLCKARHSGGCWSREQKWGRIMEIGRFGHS